MWIRIGAGLVAGIAMGSVLLFAMIYSGYYANWQMLAASGIAAGAMPFCLRFKHGALLPRGIMWLVSLAINMGYALAVSISARLLAWDIMLVHLVSLVAIAIGRRVNEERNG